MRSEKAYTYPVDDRRGAVAGGHGVGVGKHGAGLARLEVARRRMELWRKTRQGRARIPERLWKSAVRLAAAYGLCRTAQILGLNYTTLKEHVEAAGLLGHEGLRLRRRSPSPDGSPIERAPARTASIPRAAALKNFKATPRIAQAAQHNPAMTFVELAPTEHATRPQCMIELEHPRGAKMRIHLTDNPSPEVMAALSQVFLGIEP
jgi:hypothetical protein